MTLRLNGTTGYVEIDAPATAGSNTLVLPTGNGTARQTMMTNGAGALSFSWDAGSLFYRINADISFGTSTTAQAALGVGVTLTGSTVYAIEGQYGLFKSAGTTSHNVGFGFGGTATVNNIFYEMVGGYVVSATPRGDLVLSTAGAGLGMMSNTVSIVDAAVGFSAAALSLSYSIRGTVSINAGGTFIPQYKINTSPGGAWSMVAGSYIKFTPIGAAGSASSQGTWS